MASDYNMELQSAVALKRPSVYFEQRPGSRPNVKRHIPAAHPTNNNVLIDEQHGVGDERTFLDGTMSSRTQR